MSAAVAEPRDVSAVAATQALAAVIGSPVSHSLSPALHNAAFRAVGLPWVFVSWEVPEGYAPEALASMERFGVAGLSVTMPHKSAVAEAVDSLAEEAETLGAVNCVVRETGSDGVTELVGHNTDGYGFLACLREDAGFDPADAACLILGAGGAARASVLALADAGASRIAVANRTPERAEKSAALAGDRGEVVSADAAGEFDLVINATPLGMGEFKGEIPVSPMLLHPGQTVLDLIYDPPETPLLAQARAKGIRACNGLGMLIHQAARAFELWTSQPAPLQAMTSAVLPGAASSSVPA